MIDLPETDRRGILAGFAALLGAAALPIEALAAPAGKTTPFLPAPRFALLSSVADTMLPVTDTPGALAAQVPARLGAMLKNWAASATRAEILAALDRIDASAKAAKGRSFAALSAKERETVLRAHDAAALKPTAPLDANKAGFLQTGTVPTDAGYKRLKELVIGLYYYSPTGSEHELVYDHVPGPYQASVKLTPKSRPFLGLGPF